MGKVYLLSDVSWAEWEKIRHEVNTNYSKYRGKELIIHKSVGLDHLYYNYYIENLGFDQLRLIARVENLD